MKHLYITKIFTPVYKVLLLRVNIPKMRLPVVLLHRFEAAEVLLLLVDFCIYSQFGNPANDPINLLAITESVISENDATFRNERKKQRKVYILTALSSIRISASNSVPPIRQRFSSFSARAVVSVI